MTYGQIMDYIKNYKICNCPVGFEEVKNILERYKTDIEMEQENNILPFKKGGDHD